MKLIWNVYKYNISSNKIEVFNIFDHYRFAKETEGNLKKYKEKERFATALKTDLIYYFWSKYEYEVIISSFPTRITTKELDRLNKERVLNAERYGYDPKYLNVNLDTEIKIDIYEQVMNNFNIFLDYVWNSK